MTHRFRGIGRDDSGANAVEFALISALVAFPLIFGAITGAWAWNTQQTLTHAAREGARVAATLPDPDNDPNSAWHSAIVTRTEEAAHGLNASDLDVCVYYTANGPYGEPAPADAHCFEDRLAGVARVQVRIETPAQIFGAFLPADWTALTLSSDAVARHEGELND